MRFLAGDDVILDATQALQNINRAIGVDEFTAIPTTP